MNVLEKIKTEEFVIDLGYQLPAKPMHKLLSGCPETLKIREGYQNGSISEVEIRDFVQGLLKEFKFDEKFYYDLTLATIAVALEKCYTNFADEYLYDLSKLELTELKIASDIAKDCLMEKEKLPLTIYKKDKYEYDSDLNPKFRISFLDSSQRLSNEISNQYADA